LEVAQPVIEEDDVRLSHAEYSNDQMEMRAAETVIRSTLSFAPQSQFVTDVEVTYGTLAPDLDAFIFCMSTGTQGRPNPQDVLSQWRAYGQDGRGISLTLETKGITDLVQRTPGLRINPVIYDKALQVQLIQDILAEGLARHNSGDPNAVAATIGALVFTMPLMKAAGFAEEREWRLIFMPPAGGPPPKLGFQPRRDFLAPFISLEYIWRDLREKLIEIPALAETLPRPMTPFTWTKIIPITEVMVGPSGHQLLNKRSIAKLLAQANRPVSVSASDIPYRSLA
jgi:hypothetical protein